jgi:hypothetical protein
LGRTSEITKQLKIEIMDFITLMPIEAYSMPSSTFVPDDSHVMVINTARDMEWDDFGGGWSDRRTKTLQARTNAYKQWLLNFCKPTASPTDTGITFMENGVCHTAANRILIVSDGDTNVRLAPGDEYAILFFGKYGLGISDFKKKLKDSFNKTAKSYFMPNCILDDVLKRIDNSWEEEWSAWRLVAEKECNLDVRRILNKNVSGGFSNAERHMKDFIAKQHPDYESTPDIKWNFTKFLIDRDGNVVDRFEPTMDMAQVEEKVAAIL